ncbi:hypothetical protein P1X14_18310 [Sphingomonas sp. AOB5]|uniref:peptidoglycan-binding domain-containing protein n=1 Tax=Sphingomonas sp. AOB5 TaxID=3034017 RepID=UPI0023F6380C|nr:hypothetical protein [Sphingomonas sp. AOB5]MDF7777219.1 hypothetical protein [Sphingomonas sp. AOB5]
MASISASVGSGGVNKTADVLTVEKLLNQYLDAEGEAPLKADGVVDIDTILTIQNYQRDVVGIASPDGKVDPGGRTWQALDSGQGMKPPLSGASWWQANQAKYPNSDKIADLEKPFRDNVTKFIQAMKDGGASVTVAATRRNETRAKLMHYCWKVSKGQLAPDKVPAIPGVRIQWDHGNLAKSKKGAQEMSDLFGLAYEPSLTSLHIKGLAIDMTIGWTSTLKIKDATGKTQELAAPRSGESNTKLHAIGAGYKVVKLVSDPPHWSVDGR